MARTATTERSNQTRKKRPGIHAKSKTSSLKGSKLYKKKYKGQGR